MDETQPGTTGMKTRVETPLYQESVMFYTELMGMAVLDSWNEGDDKGAILGLGRPGEGEAFLELASADRVRICEGMSLQFRVSDIAAAAGRLSGRVEFRGPEKRPWGSTYLYLKDPIGIPIILYEGDL